MEYSFEGSYRAYPALDSIHINDTIWLESTVPVQLYDFVSNQTVDFSRAENLGFAANYIEMTGGDVQNPGGIPAANNFTNVLIKGIEIPSPNLEQTRVFRFTEENGNYFLKLGIVPKKKGLFLLGFGNSTNVHTKANKCIKAAFAFAFTDTQQHLYLYEQSRPGYVLTGSDRAHLYAFKVY
jgi:hypothetical protein